MTSKPSEVEVSANELVAPEAGEETVSASATEDTAVTSSAVQRKKKEKKFLITGTCREKKIRTL